MRLAATSRCASAIDAPPRLAGRQRVMGGTTQCGDQPQGQYRVMKVGYCAASPLEKHADQVNPIARVPGALLVAGIGDQVSPPVGFDLEEQPTYRGGAPACPSAMTSRAGDSENG